MSLWQEGDILGPTNLNSKGPGPLVTSVYGSSGATSSSTVEVSLRSFLAPSLTSNNDAFRLTFSYNYDEGTGGGFALRWKYGTQDMMGLIGAITNGPDEVGVVTAIVSRTAQTSGVGTTWRVAEGSNGSTFVDLSRAPITNNLSSSVTIDIRGYVTQPTDILSIDWAFVEALNKS